MNESGSVELAVAIGRIEEMLKSMNDKLDKLESTTDLHWKKLNEHDTEIQLLKQRQGPRVPVVTWLAGVAALVALVLGVLDRIFVNQ